MAKSKKELDELWEALRTVRAEIAYCKSPSRSPDKARWHSTRLARQEKLDRLEAERAKLLEELRRSWG
jgi:hypothetical protein